MLYIIVSWPVNYVTLQIGSRIFMQLTFLFQSMAHNILQSGPNRCVLSVWLRVTLAVDPNLEHEGHSPELSLTVTVSPLYYVSFQCPRSFQMLHCAILLLPHPHAHWPEGYAQACLSLKTTVSQWSVHFVQIHNPSDLSNWRSHLNFWWIEASFIFN